MPTGCKDDRFNYYFIANNEYYRPLMNSTLISKNRIQFVSTYQINKDQLMSERKLICLVRNENGFNFKIMRLKVLDQNSKTNLISSNPWTSSMSRLNWSFILIGSLILIFVLLIFFIWIFIVFKKMRTNKIDAKRKSNCNENQSNKDLNGINGINGDGLRGGYLNNLNTFNQTRSQNDYLNTFDRFNNKIYQDKMKNSSTLLINNLIQTGRLNPSMVNHYHHIDLNYASSPTSINDNQSKTNRSKLNSFSNLNSFQRNLNTPVQDDASSYQNHQYNLR